MKALVNCSSKHKYLHGIVCLLLSACLLGIPQSLRAAPPSGGQMLEAGNGRVEDSKPPLAESADFQGIVPPAPVVSAGVVYTATVDRPADLPRRSAGFHPAATEIRQTARLVWGEPAPQPADIKSAKNAIQQHDKLIPDLSIPNSTPPDNNKPSDRSTGGTESPAGWTLIMEETFEGDFPTGAWQVLDVDGATNGEYYWDDDDYWPYAGGWSAWPANGGANALDPEFYYYPDNLYSWMFFGPFDLSSASYADFMFQYWNQSEETFDYLFWGASINGTEFWGTEVSGDSGGWVEETFPLTEVPELGNLVGQPAVWIAFVFASDSSVVDDGAFVDNVTLWRYFPDQPNLAPYAPEGWPFPIVPSVAPSTHAVDEIPSNATTYIDWAAANWGAHISQPFDSCLYLDGAELNCWGHSGLPYNTYAPIEDWRLERSPGAGRHTLTLVVDARNDIVESDENDNTWSGEFGWTGVDCSLYDQQYCRVFMSTIYAPQEPMPQPVNANFDQGAGSGWGELVNSQNGRLIYHRSESDTTPVSGDWHAWLGGVANQINQLRQRLPYALPQQYETKLQFWYWSISLESSCANDWAEIRISGGALLRLGLCTQNNTAPVGSTYGWRLSAPISLDAFRGQTVMLEFVTSLNGSRNSNFLIEDVVVCSDYPSAPGPRCQSPTAAAVRNDSVIRSAVSNTVTNYAGGAKEKGQFLAR